MEQKPDSIERRVHAVKKRIAMAAAAASRDPDEIRLLAVSKTRSVEEVQRAMLAGCRYFGESYLQDAQPKLESLAAEPLEWHFIGPLQSNKTANVAAYFHWVHSIEREKIATRLSEQRSDSLPPLNVCIQVNISGEESKSGVSPEHAIQLARDIDALPRLVLRGLMTIPPRDADEPHTRAIFRNLRDLLLELQDHGLAVDTLSMGMSDDLEIAIAEGATIVRVGTDIFGPRNTT